MTSFAQPDSACTGPSYGNINFTNIRQKKIAPIAVGGSPGDPRYVSMLQHTPPNYNPANLTTLYPVVIYFGGYGSAAETPRTNPVPPYNAIAPYGVDPCAMLDDQPTSLPGKIAENKFRDSAFFNGQWYKFIVLQFQYDAYNYFNGSNGFPSASSVDSVIDYALANYRVDPSRIYLTGMSAGSNIVIEYAGSSVARANRVAAITVSSTCSQIGVWPNPANAAVNIATAGLPVRFISCTADGSGGPGTCPHSTSVNWVNQINAAGANPQAELIVLDGSTGPFACEGFAHNSWNKLYDSAFRFNGRNMLEWYAQYTNGVSLPVKLENYTARLNSGKVYLDWSTSREINADSYTIEKAGADQRYSALSTVKANGNSTAKSSYRVIDNNPVNGINYYRLVQTDADGKKNYYETRIVLNSRSAVSQVVISPNPVNDDVSVYINVNKSQRVTFTITDMNGKVLKTRTSNFGEGTTGVTIPATDLPAGVYFLRTAGEDFSTVQKLVKQ
ncbi:MAG: T9SS type A sorting domain-containing protein [Chitinophagaceae bacterium]|nr:T9SS type A sorting domain-containing protein [Chitinophagaceae bacterium]